MAKLEKTETKTETKVEEKKTEKLTRKLFNRGLREIACQNDVVLKPNKAGKFTDAEADSLMRLFSHELIDMDDVTEAALTVQTAQAEARDRAATMDNGQHEKELADRLKLARDKRAQDAYDAAIVEGFKPYEARQIAGLPADADDEAAKAADEAEKAKAKNKA